MRGRMEPMKFLRVVSKPAVTKWNYPSMMAGVEVSPLSTSSDTVSLYGSSLEPLGLELVLPYFMPSRKYFLMVFLECPVSLAFRSN